MKARLLWVLPDGQRVQYMEHETGGERFSCFFAEFQNMDRPGSPASNVEFKARGVDGDAAIFECNVLTIGTRP